MRPPGIVMPAVDGAKMWSGRLRWIMTSGHSQILLAGDAVPYGCLVDLLVVVARYRVVMCICAAAWQWGS